MADDDEIDYKALFLQAQERLKREEERPPLSEIYKSAYRYLQLKPEGQRLNRDPLSSEKDLEAYERFGVEEHVHDIITELCKIPAACNEFGLGNGIQFTNHTNLLEKNEARKADARKASRSGVPEPRPDQFCINRVNRNTATLLRSVEYKPD
ncbi:hypothetical protein HK57_00131 [Aspergillus ustus]|uniref:Uncharacterized protein n=1 Tax=Aspergillus ustus TaxID=40382 RepID=A0A0C1BV23_ASPUT|nr:hypothetical protein HK57_00131 [Aspergillus ustus]